MCFLDYFICTSRDRIYFIHVKQHEDNSLLSSADIGLCGTAAAKQGMPNVA